VHVRRVLESCRLRITRRVADLGAGIALAAEPTTDEIVGALEQVLADPSYRDAARALGTISRRAGGADAAAAELESLFD
jgi:UDP:flavonoid glycosyltransferase YjiC (YdhE family)